MPNNYRAIPAARQTVMALSLLAGCLFLAVPLRAQTSPAAKSRPLAQASKSSGPLEIVPWFSLEPQDSGLIRNAGGAKGIDLSSRSEDDTNITVFGRKATVDLHADREHDYSAPGWSDITMPRDIPIGPPSSCSSGAYRTIGGQPANGADLVGGLGGGRC